MILKGIVGSRCRLIIKTNGDNGRYFLDGMMRFPRISCGGVRRSCRDKVHRVDAQVEEESGCDRFMLRDEAWRRYLRSWESEDFRLGLGKRRRIGTRGRRPWTGPSKHGGGSVSFATTQERLAPERRRGGDPATPEQSVDDEAVYLNVAGESSKGRVYGLGSVGRKKRRYGTPGVLARRRRRMWCRGRVRCRCGATTKGYALHATASWDGHGRNRPISSTNHHHRHHHRHLMTQRMPPQIDPVDPPQQGDNVGRSLECYDEESGRIDRERHLHAIANEFGKSIKGRFSVISVRHINGIRDGNKKFMNSVSDSVANQKRNQRRAQRRNAKSSSMIPLLIRDGLRDGILIFVSDSVCDSCIYSGRLETE
ncbi:hypothetical protein Syun_024006 [Stephania yunnanensis]|uniref:Uncharacterized protein n=1 Tax=Stephania yunnanensis TaxID=152371 RepID=A0AAP0F9Z9_9MAGN